MMDLPQMQFRVDTVVLSDNVFQHQGPQDKHWRPIAWCSNLWQATTLHQSLAESPTHYTPSNRIPFSVSRSVRIIRLKPNGEEAGEVQLS